MSGKVRISSMVQFEENHAATQLEHQINLSSLEVIEILHKDSPETCFPKHSKTFIVQETLS